MSHQIKKEDSPEKDAKFTTQKVKEWLEKTKVNPKEEPDESNQKGDLPKPTEKKEMVVDLTRSGITRSALVSSLPKINLPVFHGDPWIGQTGMECSNHWYMTSNFPKHRRWSILKHQ